MKNLALIFSVLLVGFSANATSLKIEDTQLRNYDGNAYIFVEGDVEFSVFPDGQFDFVYVGPQKGSQITISSPNVNISFNSGYNYDAYVQYDDYGAVIQIENVPIYYDEYGRIVRAGNVDIRYNNRRIVRVGGMHVIYNNYGYFSHCTGVINVFNPYYVYRPWHIYYARPLYTHVIVYDYPYRRYYQPVRYSYHDHIHYYRNRDRVAYHNTRRDFYRPGSRVHHKDGRVVRNTDFNPNRRNTMIANSGRNTDATRNLRANETRTTRNNSRNTISERNSELHRTNDNTRNVNSTRVRTSNTRENRMPSVKTANTRSSVRSENTRTVSNSTSVRSTPKYSSSSSPNRRTSVSESRTQVTKRTTPASRSTVRKSNISSGRNATVNSSRGSSSRQSNSVRTRG